MEVGAFLLLNGTLSTPHRYMIAGHPRDRRRRRDPIVIPSHMPENHRQYLAYTKEDFETWASGIGPNTKKVVRFFLESGKAPEQGFKSCVSLKKYAERYKKERIEEFMASYPI
jgi:hypothetical protein